MTGDELTELAYLTNRPAIAALFEAMGLPALPPWQERLAQAMIDDPRPWTFHRRSSPAPFVPWRKDGDG